jgi:hypothetical protein
VTLIITFVRSEGVWQCSDHRVNKRGVRVDDDTPKQLSIHCPPDNAGQRILLAFTGLAEMPDGTPTLRWIRETIRGQPRFVTPTLEFIRDRLTRDLRGTLWAAEPLVLAGGVLETSGKRFYVQIANINARFEPLPEFKLAIVEVEDSAFVAIGSRGYHVTASDQGLLKAQLNVCPNRWDDHLGLLAGVNRRTALADPSESVSPWCHVSSMRVGKTGVQSKVFREPGDPPAEQTMNLVVNGLDYSELATPLLIRMSGREPTTQEVEEAGVRVATGRP